MSPTDERDNSGGPRPWTAPTFEVHGIRPQGGTGPRKRENITNSYYPSGSRG